MDHAMLKFKSFDDLKTAGDEFVAGRPLKYHTRHAADV